MEKVMIPDKNEFMRQASMSAMHALILKSTSAVDRQPAGVAELARTYAIHLWRQMRIEPQ